MKTSHKLLLGFGVFFVLEFIRLKIVSYLYITNQAKLDAEQIFNWDWYSKNVRSVAEISDTKIIKQNGNDAIVQVSANQHMNPAADNKCSALLTYYRMNNHWFLGKVQFE